MDDVIRLSNLEQMVAEMRSRNDPTPRDEAYERRVIDVFNAWVGGNARYQRELRRLRTYGTREEV